MLCEVDDLLVVGNDDAGCQAFRMAVVDKFANLTANGSRDVESIKWGLVKSFLGINVNYGDSSSIQSLREPSGVSRE